MAMFMIYFINIESLTQTNVFLTLVLHTHLQATNVLMCLNLESSRCDASPANNHNEAHLPYWALSHQTLNTTLYFWETWLHTTSLFIHNKIYTMLALLYKMGQALIVYTGRCILLCVNVMTEEISRQGQTTSE